MPTSAHTYERLNISTLLAAAKELVQLLQDNHDKVGERDVDPIVLGFLWARFGKIDRQHRIYMYGSATPSRIDFRRRGPNATVIELAVRPSNGGNQLRATPNTDELRKLTRVKNAKLRVLLLLDLSPYPHKKDDLVEWYGRIKHTRGKFTRRPVQVLYVSRTSEAKLIWRAPT